MNTPEDLIDRIRAALDTEETGDALVEVARNACTAEQRLAWLERAACEGEEVCILLLEQAS